MTFSMTNTRGGRTRLWVLLADTERTEDRVLVGTYPTSDEAEHMIFHCWKHGLPERVKQRIRKRGRDIPT